jgi:hypothetical protein
MPFKHPTEVVTPYDTSHVHPGAFLDSSDDEESPEEDMPTNPVQDDPPASAIDPGSFAGMYRGMTTLEASRMSGQPVVQAPAPLSTLTQVQQAVHDQIVRDYTGPYDGAGLSLFLKKLYD